MINKTLRIYDYNKIIDLSIYRKNPLILFNHNYNCFPIGKVLNIYDSGIEYDERVGSADCIFINPLEIYPEDKDKRQYLMKIINISEYLYPGFWNNGTLIELSLLSSQA